MGLMETRYEVLGHHLRPINLKIIRTNFPYKSSNFKICPNLCHSRMANQSSSYPIMCAAFNQDNSCFAIGTRDGFKIFDCNTGRLLYERAIGAFIIVEMLYNTNLLAIVGAGEQPSLSPRRLCLFNTMKGTSIRELNFLTSILSVRLNRERLIVILQEKVYIYDINSLRISDEIDTVPNLKGLCAFSPNLDASFLALPASTTKGSVLVYNVSELHSHCEIDAHRSPLAAMAFSSSGMYIATASEQGTIVRVHLVSEATKSYSFRRGTYPSTIFSLSFGSSSKCPNILLATSSSGSVHVFSLDSNLNQRSGKLNSLIGSVMLDPAHHHVLHHAVPTRVKSVAAVRKIDKVNEESTSGPPGLRAIISIISHGGHFQEYGLRINHQNEASWTLEHEYSLLTAVTE